MSAPVFEFNSVVIGQHVYKRVFTDESVNINAGRQQTSRILCRLSIITTSKRKIYLSREIARIHLFFLTIKQLHVAPDV